MRLLVNQLGSTTILARGPGIEPGFPESESGVLPIAQPPKTNSYLRYVLEFALFCFDDSIELAVVMQR